MENEKRRAYSEIVEILKKVDEERLEKIPFEVVEMIKNNSDPTYRPEISTEKELEEQNLQEETYSILAWIATKYWGEKLEEIVETEEIQEDVKKEIKEKTEEKENIVRNAAVYNDMDPEAMGENRLESYLNLPATVKSVNIYQKIKSKIIALLKRIFRGNKGKIKEGVD